jgi:hypothetical protein
MCLTHREAAEFRPLNPTEVHLKSRAFIHIAIAVTGRDNDRVVCK